MKSKIPKINPPKNSKLFRDLAIYFVVGLLILWILSGLNFSPGSQTPTIAFSQVVTDLAEQKVAGITVEGDKLLVKLTDGSEAISYKDPTQSLLTQLKDAGTALDLKNVEIINQSQEIGAFWAGLLSNLIPVGLTLVLFLFLIRQAQKSSGNILGFGRSTARLFNRETNRVTFADVAGVDEAKQELTEVVDFLKHPEKYRKLGARIPKGVLLVGPAGTGKTLLARAVAGEANVPFFSMAGSEFIEMLVGVGASRVRDLFQNAKRAAPSIIFIDEIESIGHQRGLNPLSSHGEQEQTLNQILVEMDGFEPSVSVVVLAATNRPDMLDPALTRPGRFDRRIVLELPDLSGRKDILKIHMKGKPFVPDIDLDKMARRTVGFSGADIENMLNEAAILAARVGQSEITNADLEEAATKVKLGPARQRAQSEEDKRMTAYHEAGHAIVAANLPHMDPVHRVSIISRGLALGYTEINPEIDRFQQTKTRLLEQIVTLLGGRVAEEMIFNEMTVGAGSDLEKASMIARRMVTDFGMSDLGPLTFSEHPYSPEGGSFNFWEKPQFSEDMSGKIDQEVKKFIDRSYQKAKEILTGQKAKLELVAGELLRKETIESEDFQKLLSA